MVSEPRTLSAGVVVVHCDTGRFRYLLLRAYRYWDFPKGRVEPGETPIAAARREVEEETGLTNLDLRWGETYRDTEPYRAGKVARYYLAHCASTDVRLGISPQLGRPEHHEYRWLPYAEARALVGPRVRTILDWAHQSIGERCVDDTNSPATR